MHDLKIARQLLLSVLYIYLTAFGLSFGYLCYKGFDLLSSIWTVILGEPWFSLIGRFTFPSKGELGWTDSGIYDDNLGTFELGLLVISGLINAGILWGSTILLKRKQS